VKKATFVIDVKLLIKISKLKARTRRDRRLAMYTACPLMEIT
jgi:hypothetical protein